MVYQKSDVLTGAVVSAPVRKSAVQKKLLISGGKNEAILQVDEKEQEKQDVKQAIADGMGIAVTASEQAVLLDQTAEDAVNERRSKNGIAFGDDLPHKSVQETVRDVRIAKQAIMLQEREKLLDKVQAEIEREVEKARLLYVLENGRKNAIDAARAKYGNHADVGSIQQAYDGMANNIDPQVCDITDIMSMSLDNKLHGQECVRMLMPNGSIRIMDSDVAVALSLVPKDGVLQSLQHENQKLMSGDTEVPVPMFSSEELVKLRELSDIMSDNARRQAAFAYKDPRSGEVEIKSNREKRLRKLGIPSIAMEYDYVYYLADNAKHNGRPLPSAMDAYDMQSVMQGNQKSYGFYK